MRHCHATEEVISSLADDSAHVALVSPPSEDLLRENVIRRAKEKVVDERTPLITHPTTPGLRGGAHTWQIRVASCERTSLPTHTHTHPSLDAPRLRQIDSVEELRAHHLVAHAGPLGVSEPLPLATHPARSPRMRLDHTRTPSFGGALSAHEWLDFFLTVPKLLHGLHWPDYLVLLSFLLSWTGQRRNSRVTKQHWTLLLLALVGASNASYITRTHDRQLQAATSSRTVNSTTELEAAIADSSLGRIVVLEGSYLLSSQLQINRDVIIEAEIPGTVVLDGQGSTRVMQISSGTVELIGLNITGGLASGDRGGGIHISGSNTIATIKGCYIYSNEARQVRFCIADVGNNTHSNSHRCQPSIARTRSRIPPPIACTPPPQPASRILAINPFRTSPHPIATLCVDSF